MQEPVSTLEYEVHAEGFGAPMNVMLNGQRIQGVQSIETTHRDGEFTVAVITLGGVLTNIKTKEA